MFYSVFVLGKKGPLARVWLAAHWDKKITKAQILETNIAESVDSILQPRVKLSLRTSSHLLLGIVRIYARKTMYLLQDCQDAAFKIKSAFRPGAVDLPADKIEAAISAINLPETFDFINDFDLIADTQINVELPQTAANINKITLADEPTGLNMEDSFMPNFREWEDMTGSRIEGDRSLNASVNALEVFNKEIPDEGFDYEDIFQVPAESVPVPGHQQDKDNNQPQQNQDHDHDNLPERPVSSASSASSMSYGAPPSGPPSTPGTPHSPERHDEDNVGHMGDSILPEARDQPLEASTVDKIQLPDLDKDELPKRGGPRVRKKRGAIIIDDPKTLSGEEMKNQLSDFSDTVCNLDLAPPNKKIMNYKKTGGAEKLFSLSERFILSEVLQTYFSRHCYTRQIKEFEEIEPLDDYVPLVNGEITHQQDNDYEMIQQADLDLIPQTPGKPPQTPGSGRSTKPRSTPVKRKHNKDSSRKHKEPRLDNNHVGSRNESITELNKRQSHNQQQQYVQPVLPDDEDDEEEEYRDEYYPPDSVAPDESKREDESNEQYEERVRNIRTTALLKYMNNELETMGRISFSHLVESNRKKQVAQKFFSILVLKKQHAIELRQDTSTHYGEITITRGHRYEEVLNLLPHQV